MVIAVAHGKNQIPETVEEVLGADTTATPEATTVGVEVTVDRALRTGGRLKRTYTGVHTVSKSVRLPEDFHEYIEAHKRADETMEDTLRRLIGGPYPEEVGEFSRPRRRTLSRKVSNGKGRPMPSRKRTSGSCSSDPGHDVSGSSLP